MGEASAIPRRQLGRTGLDVSIVAIGGFHLGNVADPTVATRIVHEAVDGGVNLFENAWEYHDGQSEMLVGEALRGRRAELVLMSQACTHGRDKRVALTQLDASLRRLRTDHLDLWLIHECVYDDDPALCFVGGGVVEALDEAKRSGKARFVGFGGHKDPAIHLDMLGRGYAFDVVQLPLNCFDASFRSFERLVLPELGARGIGALGMKSLGGGDAVRAGVVTADEALGYALSLPVASVVTGVDSPALLRRNLAIARSTKHAPMGPEQMDALRARVAGPAADGRFELYKTTMHFDGELGRQQHGFPPRAKLPL
jgi:uncharacterized protein